MSFLQNVRLKFQAKKYDAAQRVAQDRIRKMHEHDSALVQKLVAKKTLPSFQQWRFLSKYLSRTEKLVLRILTGIVLVCLLALGVNVYFNYSEAVPVAGGSYTEGLVGSPRHINPMFSQSNDADMDIASLVYSGLLKFTQTGFEPDLAESYTISEDQKIYTFKLRQDVYWHDGEKFDADDVIFTFGRIANPLTKTTLYYNFKGATFEKVDQYTVKIILAEAFAPFIESLSVGILPEHLWQDIQPENTALADYNLKPVGTGPYKFKSLLKNKQGEIKSLNLERNAGYYAKTAYIENLTFKFHGTIEEAIEAMNNKNIEGLAYLPKELRERIINNRNLNFHLLQLPQYTAVFFNSNESPVLKDVQIRKLLSHSVNKEKIVNEILNAEAQIIDSCILPGSLGYNPDIAKFPYNIEYVKAELEKAGWTLADYKQETPSTAPTPEATPTAAAEEYLYQVRKLKTRYLEFSLTTVEHPEYIEIAKELIKEWQVIGAKVNLVLVKPDQIQEIIKTRNYETLLYGQVLGQDPDPYPFWHSSQKSFPGLNLTSLVDPKIDKLLEEARKTANAEERAGKYKEFQKLLAEQAPAVFLYNPTYTYPQSKKIKNFTTSKIITPSNRFQDITSWYIKTTRKLNF